MTAVSINTVSPETFTSCVLIGDIITSPGGSNDVPPTMTREDNVPVSAALEIQSTQGALLLPRMTETQRDASSFIPTDGMMIFNTTDGVVNVYQDGAWIEGSGDVVGPGISVTNDIAIFADTTGELLADSGVNISSVAPPLLSLGYGDPLLTDVQISGLDILNFGSSGSNDVGVIYRQSDYVCGIFPNTISSKFPNVVFGFANPSSTDAAVELTQGALLLSRLTQTQINSLVDVDGMIVFNEDIDQFNFRQAGGWVTFSGKADSDSTYIVQTADATLPNAQSLGLLTTGLLKNNVSGITGVLSTAVLGTDYGNVVGPSSAVASNFAMFSGTTGKVIADSGISSLTVGSVTSITAGTNLTGGTITTSGTIALSATPTGLTSLGVGGLSLSSQQISGTGTNTDIIIRPNGSGSVVLGSNASPASVSSIGTIFGTGVSLNGSAIISGTQLNINNINIAESGGIPGVINFYNSTETHYIGLSAPNSVPASIVFLLPSVDGSSGQALTTDGSQGLSFSTVANRAASYIVQTADASLTGAQVLGSLATGILKNTTTTGVLSIATAGTDYGTVSSITAGTNLTGGTITTTGTIALSATPSGLTSLGVGNLSFSGHQISGTGTNQDINIVPNGTGSVVTGAAAVTLTSTGLIIATTISVTNVNSTNTNAVAFTVAASGSVPGVVNFNDATNTHLVGLTAPNAISSSFVLVLPAADGTTGQALTTDGSKNLSFSTVANRAAKFIVQTSDSSLTNAQVLGSLATGLVKNTTTTGVLSIGTAGTDYYSATHPTTLYEDANHNIYLGNTSGTNPAPAGVTDNIVMGAGSGIAFISGAVGNVLLGSQAGPSLTSGSQNIYLGNLAGALATTAASNVAIGNAAGSGFVGYTSCTFIGASADASGTGLTNATAIGAGAIVNTSNSLVLGSGAKVGIGLSSPLFTLHLSSSAQAIKVAGGFIANYTTNSSSTYTLLSSDFIYSTTRPSTGTLALTVPTATTTNKGQMYHIKDASGNAATNNITITPTSGNIDNAANVKITTNFGKVTIFSDGSNWFTI